MKKILIFMGCIIFTLTSCDLQSYPRLEANEKASKLTQANENSFIEFNKLIFPDYEVVEVCHEEFRELSQNPQDIKESTMYYRNAKSECGFQTDSVLVKVNGEIFITETYYTDLKINPESFKGEKRNCFTKVSTDKKNDYANIFSVYYYDNTYYSREYDDTYCPNKNSFKTENEQLINYVYDSYLLMK